MKKLFFLSYLIFIFNYSIAQDKHPITIGNIEQIDSKILNEEREIWIYVPNDNDNDIYQKKKYPVVYLLDGDAHFYSMMGMIHQLSSINGNTTMPKMIIVGIPNTNRSRDLTPSKPDKPHQYAPKEMIATSGGGDQFMSFIEKELIPHIDANYPTEQYRMFIGHSLGGLMVMDTYLNKPDLFSSYISIDPSMWWHDKQLLKEFTTASLDQEKYKRKSLYLGIANTLPKGMPVEKALKDESTDTEHFRAIMELNDLLEKNKQLNFNSKYYPKDSHGSVPLITEYDALRFIFDFYELRMESKDYLDPKSDFAKKVVDHYKKISLEFGREIKPAEEYVNNMAYQFMQMQQMEKSEAFFKLNVKNYPDSFNTYDSLGDFYATSGDKKKAILNYKKSIELNPNSMSKEKLKELEKK